MLRLGNVGSSKVKAMKSFFRKIIKFIIFKILGFIFKQKINNNDYAIIFRKANNSLSISKPIFKFNFHGVYTIHNMDNVISGDFYKNFCDAVEKYEEREKYIGLIYRYYLAANLADAVKGLAGCFVFAGVSFGLCPYMVCKQIESDKRGKNIYLIDDFKWMSPGREERHVHYCKDQKHVEERFSEFKNISVNIINGLIPGAIREIEDELISFLYLDTTNSPAEIESLPELWKRLSPGGIILMDDYNLGAGLSMKQRDEVIHELGGCVISTFNGQGIVFKPYS